MSLEADTLKELRKLCTSQGYVHALAALSYRDNFYTYANDLTPEVVANNFSKHALIRQEISLLTRLLASKPVDLRFPGKDALARYIEDSDILLRKLHESLLNFDFAAHIQKDGVKTNPFTRGDVVREAIFYSGETAYDFQYFDLAEKKYASDDAWIIQNRGFKISDAINVAKSIASLHTERALMANIGLQFYDICEVSLLNIFTFTIDDLCTATHLPIEIITNVIQAFVTPSVDDVDIISASDLNQLCISPILRLSEHEYALFQMYSLAESIYESPFYWFLSDKPYKKTAEINRGKFTEDFSYTALCKVFGPEHVFKNVNIKCSQQIVGEIDVLVLFGCRAIVLQAKSKKLTILARQGNDAQIKSDFEKSIQAAYDQGVTCGKCFFDNSLHFIDSTGNKIDVSHIDRIHIICVVSDNYPSLNFQSRHFLKRQTIERISYPLVLDVFTLDAICEILSSPLLLLSYIERRVKYADSIIASSELLVLSYHLGHNLFIANDNTILNICDDIGCNIDVAMYQRRVERNFDKTPDGILRVYNDNSLGRLLKRIDLNPIKVFFEFGLSILELCEEAFIDISTSLDRIAAAARRDGKSHDLTTVINECNFGITIHCNNDSTLESKLRLFNHCELRKYKSKVDNWYGLCLNPKDLSLRFGLSLKYKWKFDLTMPKSLCGHITTPTQKIGRNMLCPCGSGKKFKKCCQMTT